MSKNFYLDNGKTAINTSFYRSGYNMVGESLDLNFFIQATTRGLKTFSIILVVRLTNLDTSIAGGKDQKFHIPTAMGWCSNF